MPQVLTALRAGARSFRGWRRTRPFWGGLLLVAAGIELLVAPAAQTLLLPIDLIVYAGVAGVSGYLIGVLLMVVGVLCWLQPAQNVFFGIVGLLLALVSFLTSNFGGFVLGMLLGIIGGALVFAWAPSKERSGRPRNRRRRHGRTAGAAAEGPADPDTDPGPAPSGSAVRALVSIPLALALIFPSASAPAGLGWPWDWFFPRDGGTGEPSPEPSADPPPEPGPESGTETGDAHGDQREPADGTPGDPGADEDAEDSPEEADPADAADCRFEQGDAAVTESEEELLEAVEACRAAQQLDQMPQIPLAGEGGCAAGSTVESGLTSDRLTMIGARFDGVVECQTADGPQRYLKLSMGRADFHGAELWFTGGDGARASLGLPAMVMDGRVEMHVTRMHVRILGIPLTFTPDFPPPLLLPIMIVTDVDVDHPIAQTDVMTIPDLRQRF